MKYKVWDEVLVKCKVISDFKNGYIVTNSSNMCFGLDDVRSIFASFEDVYPVSILQDATVEEAWEITKKFNSLSSNDLMEIFDTYDIPYILQNLTIWQIKEKIEGWELNQIKVGDFAKFEDGIFCVTSLIGEYCCGMDMNGLVYSVKKKYAKKTGRHIDIDKILEQIGDTDA